MDFGWTSACFHPDSDGALTSLEPQGLPEFGSIKVVEAVNGDPKKGKRGVVKFRDH